MFPGLLVPACWITCAVVKIISHGYYAATHPTQHITDGFGEHVYGQTSACYASEQQPSQDLQTAQLMQKHARVYETACSTNKSLHACPSRPPCLVDAKRTWPLTLRRAAAAAAALAATDAVGLALTASGLLALVGAAPLAALLLVLASAAATPPQPAKTPRRAAAADGAAARAAGGREAVRCQ